MTPSSNRPDEPQASASGRSARLLKIFISYRRADTSGTAIALYDRLANRFDAANVFLDVKDLQPGIDWLEEIKARGASCGVFIALIGSQWTLSLKSRHQAAAGDTLEDEVRREIEIALSRGSGVEVIPVLVDDATMPTADDLPKSIRALASRQAERIRHSHFDHDVAHLIVKLGEVEQRRQPPAAPAPIARSPEPTSPPPLSPRIAPPDEHHYAEVLAYMVDEGTVVAVLGPNFNELAADLSRRFKPQSGSVDLAEVAQYVYVTSGSPDLYRTLRQTLLVEREPSAVHRFLASFPATLDRLGLPMRYQLIVTTNYDTELERAFDAANEPYDLVVYMASGADAGKFVHFPFHSDPQPITIPNDYGRLPIDVESDELDRTVIVKIHGAVDGSSGGYRWKENYVITEDDYIDYLSRSPIENLVPTQILTKLRDSHCLFLGYSMHDWNLRVFLNRIWNGEPLNAKSWAIERDPDILEREFWHHGRVDLFSAPLAQYVSELVRYLLARHEVATRQ